jgi:coenzyme F420-reducing hydrogenase delta subunit
MGMKNGFEPEIVVLYCQNALKAGERLGEGTRLCPGFRVRFVALPCSSKIEVYHLVKHLERGADGVQVVACPPDSCRLLVGNTKADKKIIYVRRLLTELQAGPERVGLLRGHDLTASDVLALAQERAEAVLALEARETVRRQESARRLASMGQ